MILNVAGPLGTPSEVEDYGTCVIVGGGIGSACALPVARALKEAGNYLISIIGAKTKDLLILEDDFRDISDELHITTDDGSYGRKGFTVMVLLKWFTFSRGFFSPRIFSSFPEI